MFESMIADFQSRHDISQAAVLELGGLLQQAALSNFSVLQTVNNVPASVLGVMCVAFRALGPLPSRHLDAHPAKYLKSHCASNHVTSASTDKPAFSARNATYMTPWS